MRRREFIVALGGAVAWPLAVRAQQLRMRRVSILSPVSENDPDWQLRLKVFLGELQKLGWAEGRNVRFDHRWAGADPERMRADAAELISLVPDVILTSSNQSASILGRQTRTIPIVFVGAGDPVGTGLVANMARPGGNMTGFTTYESAIAGKRVELLREVAPRLTRLGVLYTPGGAGSLAQLHVIEAVAPSLNLSTTAIAALDPEEIERAINAFAREPNGGLAVLTGPAVALNRDRILALAAKHHLPAIYAGRYSAIHGGLMSYGASDNNLFQGAASYIDRIVKGEKPGELPIQLMTKFELVINLRTAKALGLTVPQTLLATADEVIE
jgi:putative tryptophan/tyrosine transport system substrate-binding protein